MTFCAGFCIFFNNGSKMTYYHRLMHITGLIWTIKCHWSDV
ncbi:hypothetical protein M2403_002948 [Rahnella sp. BIGb0603]|nr:hypothetical protein [Rahnella sp. BIGb0603]